MRWALAIFATNLLVTPLAARAQTPPASWPPQTSDATPAAPQAPHLYVLTFKDADIAVVTEDVLGVTLLAPYRIDPAVQGRMSFAVEERLTPEQLLVRFEAALREHGVTLRNTGTQFVLVPEAKAAPTAAAPDPSRAAAPSVAPSNAGVAQTFGMLAAFAAVGAIAAALATWRTRARLAAQPLGERESVLDYLVETGAVTRKAVARARLTGRREGAPPEQILQRDGLLPVGSLVDAYAAAGDFAVWDPTRQPALDPQPAPLAADRSGPIVAVNDDGKILTVATSDPFDDDALAQVAITARRTVRILVASSEDLRAV